MRVSELIVRPLRHLPDEFAGNGMLRLEKYVKHVALLDNAAAVHHRYAVADRTNDVHLVCNE